MKVLVTGGTGFVGRHVAARLLTDGHTVGLLARSQDKVLRLFPNGGLETILTTDLEWKTKVQAFNPEVVIHLAAYFTGREDADAIHNLIDSNLTFTTELSAAVSDTDCKAFVSTGTFTEYLRGNGEPLPNNLYSATKAAERPILGYFQEKSGWKWIHVIVYSPYGRRNESKKVMDYLLDALEAPEPVAFSDGLQRLDFIHVDDMADFYATLLAHLEALPTRQELHLGTGRATSLREVATAIEEVSGKKVNALWGARPRNSYDPLFACAPIAANIELLGWQAKLSLREGIKILLDDIESGGVKR